MTSNISPEASNISPPKKKLNKTSQTVDKAIELLALSHISQSIHKHSQGFTLISYATFTH
jgi:hypothetical protein